VIAYIPSNTTRVFGHLSACLCSSPRRVMERKTPGRAPQRGAHYEPLLSRETRREHALAPLGAPLRVAFSPNRSGLRYCSSQSHALRDEGGSPERMRTNTGSFTQARCETRQRSLSESAYHQRIMSRILAANNRRIMMGNIITNNH
jgi:hypothetical protein